MMIFSRRPQKLNLLPCWIRDERTTIAMLSLIIDFLAIVPVKAIYRTPIPIPATRTRPSVYVLSLRGLEPDPPDQNRTRRGDREKQKTSQGVARPWRGLASGSVREPSSHE